MKQYTFKDGTKVIASSVEEAKAKHKVMAAPIPSGAKKKHKVTGPHHFDPNDSDDPNDKKAVNAYNTIVKLLKEAKIKTDNTSYQLTCYKKVKSECCSLEIELYIDYDEIILDSDLQSYDYDGTHTRKFRLSQTKDAVAKFKECLELFDTFSKKSDERERIVTKLDAQLISAHKKLDKALGKRI